jgi:hypothetical protein
MVPLYGVYVDLMDESALGILEFSLEYNFKIIIMEDLELS